MTDQEKREKVIKGLTCHVHGHPHTRCHKCPYWGTGPRGFSECSVLAADALALLKKLEPRLMTLDEVLALKEGTPVYVEDSGGLHSWDVFAGIAPDSSYDVMTGAPWATAEYWPQSEYNDTWRCWTSEPSEEQREAVKWE